MATKNAKQTIVTPIDERETFVSVAKVISDADGVSMEEKLRTIFKIQQADTQIDHIHLLRGELPLEVQDLEDEVEGLKTRISNFQEEVKQIEAKRAHDRATVEASVALVEKYKAQSENVRNNREYESIQKEIEYQELDQQACAKRIAEGALLIEEKKKEIESARTRLQLNEAALEEKKKELETIVEETAVQEAQINAVKEELSKKVDERMLSAYNRVRGNAKNHLAVVTIERDACGGCFNKIPPQRTLDIIQGKKLIVCEYCGRILVNPQYKED